MFETIARLTLGGFVSSLILCAIWIWMYSKSEKEKKYWYYTILTLIVIFTVAPLVLYTIGYLFSLWINAANIF